MPHLILLFRSLGVAQQYELRTSDTHPESNAATQLCEFRIWDMYPASSYIISLGCMA